MTAVKTPLALPDGMDAYVALSPEAFAFVTGVRVPSHSIMRWRHAAALVDGQGLNSVLVVDMEHTTVKAALPDTALRVWREFFDEPMAELATMIRSRFGDSPRARVGIELDFLPTRCMETLAAELPEVTWLPVDLDLETARISKTPEQTQIIQRLVRAADESLTNAIYDVRAGDSEYQIGRKIITNLYDLGVSEHRSLIVASGPRSHYPNVGPSDRQVERGDILRVEVFASDHGYNGAVARTVVLGEPRSDMVKNWEYLSTARNEALDRLRPGADPRQVYKAYVDAMGPLAEYAIAFFGHGLGIGVHERPYVSATSQDEIVEGATIGVEPFVMIPGNYGLQMKDVVQITADGYRMLSDRMDGGELVSVEI
jgi:Xaa-Pro aminopeptidase